MNPFVLRTPTITEKTYAGMQQGIYSFYVDTRATKGQIKETVEQTFGVHVVSVRTTTVRGKSRRVGTRRGLTMTANRKKAIVTLKEGEKIDSLEVQG